jgi:hypothetical protein
VVASQGSGGFSVELDQASNAIYLAMTGDFSGVSSDVEVALAHIS